MALQLKRASRQKVKIKLQLGAASGSGKTYGALKIAYGMVGDWSKIAVIDTENDSASLYVGKDGIGEFNVISLNSFTERDYIEALKICEKAGIEVCIIDTSTRLWDTLVELQSKLGGRYQDWIEPKEKHKKYLYTMLQSNMHIISTVRKKEDYVIEQNEKTTTIKKIGLKEQQESNMNYEFTIVLDIDQKTHLTTCSKDRTGLFNDRAPFLITEETGKEIMNWCNQGENVKETQITDALTAIENSKSIEELRQVLIDYEGLKSTLDFKNKFMEKKNELNKN